jgi:hypothetical protein
MEKEILDKVSEYAGLFLQLMRLPCCSTSTLCCSGAKSAEKLHRWQKPT